MRAPRKRGRTRARLWDIGPRALEILIDFPGHVMATGGRNGSAADLPPRGLPPADPRSRNHDVIVCRPALLPRFQRPRGRVGKPRSSGDYARRSAWIKADARERLWARLRSVRLGILLGVPAGLDGNGDGGLECFEILGVSG